jgi:hypothetical protein
VRQFKLRAFFLLSFWWFTEYSTSQHLNPFPIYPIPICPFYSYKNNIPEMDLGPGYIIFSYIHFRYVHSYKWTYHKWVYRKSRVARGIGIQICPFPICPFSVIPPFLPNPTICDCAQHIMFPRSLAGTF